MNELEVTVTWDDGAAVWIATSDDVPGLVAEASGFDDLLGIVSELIPELMALNDMGAERGGTYPFHVKAERSLVTEAAA
jgi:hypothetical protein